MPADNNANLCMINIFACLALLKYKDKYVTDKYKDSLAFVDHMLNYPRARSHFWMILEAHTFKLMAITRT